MSVSDPNAGDLAADTVASQAFTVVRRGYDVREVQGYLRRLADELRVLRNDQRDLSTRLADAEARAEAAMALDEQQLTAALGAETVRILDAARTAADDIRARAVAAADALLDEAGRDAEQVRAEAATVLDERRREADDEVADRLRQAADALTEARSEAAAFAERSAADAAEVVEQARDQGRSMVSEAQQVRERMLRDLAKRRRGLRAQIEQLQVGRDRLLEAYEVVRTTLDTATGELNVALPEARSAAIAVSSEVVADSSDDDTIDADILASLADGGAMPMDLAAPPVPSSAPLDSADAEDPAPETEPTSGADADQSAQGEQVVAEAVPTGGTLAEEVPTEIVPAVVAEPQPNDSALTDSGEADSGTFGTGEDAEQAEGGSIFSRPARRAPDPEHTGRYSSAVNVIARAGETEAAHGDTRADGAPASEGLDPTADEEVDSSSDLADQERDPTSIFARLRAETDDEPIAESTDDGTESVDALDAGSEGETADESADEPIDETADAAVAEGVDDQEPSAGSDEEATPSADEELGPVSDMVDQRDAALSELRTTLARRLKRTLADEQNEVLEVLRRHRGKVDVAMLVAERDGHVQRYADASLPSLAAAASAGADLVGQAHPEVITDAPRTRVGDVAEDLAVDLVVLLRRRIEETLEAHVGDEGALGDGIRQAYRDVKQQVADDAASLAMSRVFARGFEQRVAAGTPMVWVAASGGPRSEGCRANATSAPVPKGESFPDPSVEPPCSASCRCMVVPEVAVAAPVA